MAVLASVSNRTELAAMPLPVVRFFSAISLPDKLAATLRLNAISSDCGDSSYRKSSACT